MNRVLQFAHLALLLCGAALCASGGWLLWTLRTETVAESLALQKSTDQLTVTLRTLNQDCGWGHPCGTLADISRTLNILDKTAGYIQLAAKHENDRITVLDAQEAQLASDLHSTLTAAATSLQSANGAILEAKTSIQATTPLLTAYTKAGNDLDTELATESADLHRVLIAAAGTVEETKGIAADGHKVADHIERAVDNPPKRKWYIRILPPVFRGLITAGQVYSAVP